ncbi:hypothetical protein KFU94_63365 [Chloroflexi bacterium TSY]|nr:hypothetical protein [Chloroflexi bacterium TSY]
MKRSSRSMMRALVLIVSLLVSACQPIVNSPPTQRQAVEGITTEMGALEIDSQTPYGRFNGIDYHMIEGKFVSTWDEMLFSAPFEIVAPANPHQGNGRLVIEPFHFIGGAGARDDFLGPELLFGSGFSHAAICWQLPADFVEEHPCLDFEGKEEAEIAIISAFARTLGGEDAAQLVGDVVALYSIGFSNSADPIHNLLHNPAGKDLFDLTFIATTLWPFSDEPFAPLPADLPDSLLPPEDVGRVMVLQSEADVILFNGVMHRDDGAHSYYRSYEVAGAQHVQGSGFPLGIGFVPVMRALFSAGDRWVIDGIEPPASVFLETAPADEIDPVYDRITGIARDESLNAKGGIRLPDVALGRSQYIVANLEEIWFGHTVDLACMPLADGSPRFSNHAFYVTRFVEETARLVEGGFLLPDG